VNKREVCRLTRKLTVFAAVVFMVLAASAARTAASCSGGGLSPEQAPLVDVLRSYRAAFRSPTRLALDAAGNVYIADPQGRQIVVREPSGRIASVARDVGRPVSIAVGAGGIFVGDGVDGSVTAYSPDWQFLFRLGQGPGEFVLPGDIAVDAASGNIWVTDTSANHFKLFDAAGALIKTVGEPGQGIGQFASPAGIFVDQSRARVLIADQLNARLQVFDLNGDYVSCIGTRGVAPGEFNMPQSLWGDRAGRLYVADSFEGRIQILDGNGDFVGYLGEIGDLGGQLRVPGDLLIDPFGRLFVASTGSGRVEVYGLDPYTDPEIFIPAEVDIRPDPLAPAEVSELTATIEVPGYPLDQIEPDTFRVNGVTAIPGSLSQGDLDGDTIPDLTGRFDAGAVAGTLPRNGTAEVVVTAVLAEMQIEGTDRIVVIGGLDPDADGDSVPDDAEQCPGTPPDTVVDAGGCSIDQRCPCGGPASGGSWATHGDFVTCVVRETEMFLLLGLISEEERDFETRSAARSTCGRYRSRSKPSIVSSMRREAK